MKAINQLTLEIITEDMKEGSIYDKLMKMEVKKHDECKNDK